MVKKGWRLLKGREKNEDRRTKIEERRVMNSMAKAVVCFETCN